MSKGITKIDATDHKILNILLQNARISYKELGAQVGLSAPATTERIRRMEESGIIRSYTIDVDHKKLGYDIYAFIKLSTELHSPSKVINNIMSEEGIMMCCRITGDADYMILLMAKSIVNLDSRLHALSKYGSTSTIVVLDQRRKMILPSLSDLEEEV